MNPVRFSLLAALGLALTASLALAETPATSGPAKDQGPVALKRVLPAYPAELGLLRGRAEVMVEVDANGKVVSAQVVSATAAEFAAQALAAAKAWEFQPAVKDGQRVRAWARLPFKFEPGAVAMK